MLTAGKVEKLTHPIYKSEEDPHYKLSNFTLL